MNLVKSIGSFVLFSSIAGANVMTDLTALGPVDIAVDLKSGVTYLQKKEQNAGGQILVMDSKTGATIEDGLFAYSMMVKNKDTEIELLGSGKLLSKVNDEFMVISSRKDGEQIIWDSTNLESSDLSDFSNIKNVHSESNGLISFEAFSQEAQKNVVALFSVIEKDDTVSLQKERVIIAANIAPTDVVEEEEVEEEKLERTNSLGFTAGMIAGLGLTYRKHFENRLGFHIGAVAYGNKESVNANLGAQLLATVRKNDNSRFYVLAGSAVYWSRKTDYRYQNVAEPQIDYGNMTKDEIANAYSYENTYEEAKVNDTMLNFGLGMGMELSAKQGIGLALELPITITFGTDSYNDEGMGFKQVYPIPALTIFYRF